MTESASSDNGKTVALVCYFTLIGWIIALVMHSNNKTSLGAFHIRQMLGLMLLSFAFYFVNMALGILIVSLVLNIGLLILWVLGLIGAVQGEEKPIPVLGAQFQEWFKGVA